jgi:hypothetical protein
VNQIHSEDQLKLALGTNFSLNKLADIKAGFNFNNQDGKTRVVAKFLQKYYTADMNIPDDGIFVDEMPDPTKFGSYSPVYISSLTFGRMGLFFLESSYPAIEVTLALEGLLKNLSSNPIGAGISSTCKNILNLSTIRVYTTGGAGGGAVEAISGYDGFVNFIKTGGRYSCNSRGAILAYQLRNLSDYTIFQTKLTSTYEVRSCSPVPQIMNGRFVRNSDTDEIFIFMESALRRVPTRVLNTLFHFQDADVAHYTDHQLRYIPKSTPISTDSELIQNFFSRKLYLREKNTLRCIPDMKTRLKYHFNYDNRKTKVCSNSYEYGPDIK